MTAGAIVGLLMVVAVFLETKRKRSKREIERRFSPIVLAFLGGIAIVGAIHYWFQWTSPITEAAETKSASNAASGSKKFTSEEFGFSATFPASDVKEKKIAPVMTAFTSSNPDGTEYSEVRVLTKDLSQDLVDDAYLERLMQIIRKDGDFRPLGQTKHTTLHGYPAVTQNMVLTPASGHEGFVSTMIVVSRDRNHIYMVTAGGGASEADRSRIQRFLDSFELF
jgi:hypothetical protein